MFNAIKSKLADHANQHVGLLAEFSDPGSLLHAVKGLRKRGYSRLDTFSPFPIHGMDKAVGLGTSLLGYLVFIGGVAGCALGIWLQWWTSAVAYPINISNKPLFAIEPSIPIIFELTILFSALTAVGGMLALNALPKPYNPLFFSERFTRVTDDGFFLHIQESDGQFDRATTAQALAEEGALAIEYVSHEGSEDMTTPASTNET
jgi:hypothetical protein